MNWHNKVKEWLRAWLFPQELHSLKSSVEAQQQLLNLLQSYRDLAKEHEDRRLTLGDLELKPNSSLLLQTADKAFRAALHEALQHICFTEQRECCRRAVVEMRKYMMRCTLHPTGINKLKSDISDQERVQERAQQYFTPRP